jgi:multiple sugar transport system permease protein
LDSQKAAGRRAKLMIHIILTIGAIIMVTPFLWMILTSLKTLAESTRIPPIILPSQFKLDNFYHVFEFLPFLTFYSNTVIMAVCRTAGQLLFCSMAAYAFARIQFPGKNSLFVLILSIMMVPSQSYVIPQYLLMVEFGWLNSLKALIVPGLTSAFGTFLLRQFFLSLPRDLDEAAKIDGCNHAQIYLRILLPQVVPGLMAVAIFSMLWSWNDLLWPLIVNSSPSKLPLAAGLANLNGQYVTDYPTIMAGSLLAIFPMILLFIFAQRHFIEGISLTGSKG